MFLTKKQNSLFLLSHCCVKTKQPRNTVYLRQHFVSFEIQNACTWASTKNRFVAKTLFPSLYDKLMEAKPGVAENKS